MKSDWIKCSERLPEFERAVLALQYGERIIVRRVYWREHNWRWQAADYQYGSKTVASISHWYDMELPEPPEEA